MNTEITTQEANEAIRNFGYKASELCNAMKEFAEASKGFNSVLDEAMRRRNEWYNSLPWYKKLWYKLTGV